MSTLNLTVALNIMMILKFLNVTYTEILMKGLFNNYKSIFDFNILKFLNYESSLTYNNYCKFEYYSFTVYFNNNI